MKNDEVLSIQSYLRMDFENDSINLRKKDSEDNIVDFFVSEENFGEISKDIDPDELEISYSLVEKYLFQDRTNILASNNVQDHFLIFCSKFV